MSRNASAFLRLAPFIREYIYEKKWTALREIQEAAISEIYDSDKNILLAAGTAAGKTEACFFPVISLLSEKPPASVGALYIGPLKALINDQAARLEPLLELAKIPLWRWHGDIPSPHKKKLLAQPSGILQITPESLEALLLRNPAALRPLFHDLSFVIIDEIHAFMSSDRGSQILCQLARIEDAALCSPRRIGLSATLGDYKSATKWLEKGSGSGIDKRNKRATVLIREEKSRRRLSIAVDHFYNSGASGDSAYFRALYRETRGLRNIIFTNSRTEAEEVIAALGEISRECGGRDHFFIHHGSIPAGVRSETERELRESPAPLTAAATATLEMGIDIGLLDRVIQLGPPLSVSAFVQRLGRSGRRRGKSQIYFTSLEEQRDREHPVNALPWDLLRTIAVIELYTGEKWIEPGEGNPLPYSLLVHQTLSVLCAEGGYRPAALAKKILALPAFSRVSGGDFALILSALASASLIEKTDEGNLIAGLEAEKICGRYSFYSVFSGSSECRVTAHGHEIGRINFIPPIGSSIVLGGRYWRVELTSPGKENREREIIVSPDGAGSAGTRQIWRGSGVDMHQRVAALMRKILTAADDYPYLSAQARTRLERARNLAKQWKLADRIFISGAREQGAFVILPWLGSRGMRTLLLILQNKDTRKNLCVRSLSRENDFSINITSTLPLPRFRAELAKIMAKYTTPASLYPLIAPEQISMTGKFDHYLPRSLLVKQYAAAMLDVKELKRLTKEKAE